MDNYKLPQGQAISARSLSNGNALLSDYFLCLKNKKIMLYGDSIFSTDYSWLKDALKEISGASDVYNGGFSGATTAQLTGQDKLQRAIEYAPDVCIIMVGGNDSGSANSVGTFGTYGGLLDTEAVKAIPNIASVYSGNSFIEAAAYICNYLTYHIAGFRHNAYLDGQCTDVGYQLAAEDALDLTQKPLVFVCTPLPQQRTDSSNTYSLPANNKRKADAIREIAQLCNIPMLDLAVLSGISRLNESYWTSPTDMVHNKGTLSMDGLHPNKYGYQRIAKIILHFISQYLIV